MTGQRAGNTLAGLACLCEASDWPPAGTTHRQQDVLSSRPTSSTYCIWALRLTATRLKLSHTAALPSRCFGTSLLLEKAEKRFFTHDKLLWLPQWRNMNEWKFLIFYYYNVLPIYQRYYWTMPLNSQYCVEAHKTDLSICESLKTEHDFFSSYQFVQFPMHQLHH